MSTAAEKLRQYRQTIDLVEFLEAEGFRLDTRKGSRRGRWVVLRQEDGPRKLVVARGERGGFHYFNPEDDTDRGSVVDFVRAKFRIEPGDRAGWGRLFDYLDAYLGQPRPVTGPDPVRPPGLPVRAESVQPALRPLARTEYLLSRGLSERTLSAPEFAGRIFDLPHTDRFGRSHVNTAFPLETTDGRVGVVLRNADLNQIQGRKADAFWISNVLSGEACRELFVCESPIDALSYHQLYPPDRPGQRVYVATAGSLTAGHPAALQALINRLGPRRVLLGNDGDLSGLHYNLTWLGSLSPAETATPSVRIVRRNRLVELHVDPALLCGPDAQAFREEGLRATGKADSLVWTIPNEWSALVNAERFPLQVRRLSEWAEIARAAEKDWNDELRLRQARRAGPPVPLHRLK